MSVIQPVRPKSVDKNPPQRERMAAVQAKSSLPEGVSSSCAFGIVIPARFASSRLPGKPLRQIAGKPMIVRVLENARQMGAEFVTVATDDSRIAAVVEAAGGQVMLTSTEHPSGTDRLSEVAERLRLSPESILVNVQGDEPLLAASEVKRVADTLYAHPSAGIATLATPIREPAQLFDPNVVKVVTDAQGSARYFSRAPIPWIRGLFEHTRLTGQLPEHVPFLRHIGLYAYRVGTLRKIASHEPVAVERAERLEQLRALTLGIQIQVTTIDSAPLPGVDTEEDLARVERVFAEAPRTG